jgi:hypothetical protein
MCTSCNALFAYDKLWPRRPTFCSWQQQDCLATKAMSPLKFSPVRSVCLSSVIERPELEAGQPIFSFVVFWS